MNRAGRYAASSEADELELLKIIYELTEKERMIMWVEGYIDIVIEKLPDFAKGILLDQIRKWEDTKEYVKNQIEEIVLQPHYIESLKGSRKEFAISVQTNYPQYLSLLFSHYDGKLKDLDFRTFVYRRRYGSKKKRF
ncbi:MULTISPECIES: hypothetical protein [unclassified Bacillus (in: firmicutes)]|uniref:hypothetical protein n=1 Tax=unclassified Bacillus (in: firmicutes) TaxID=185979 RepID=UPI0008EF9969|nr:MULTISPECIES: hypothetical protein [unclassified Bacillus (in: firmicutes)]SFA90855.1 hypothetical protein SAMN02799634_102518 [Bacillus sp. UNCCL13]SFQ85410.1 hypothetical protein SAMN04488577_2638 [Bacillus sp. cl95]